MSREDRSTLFLKDYSEIELVKEEYPYEHDYMYLTGINKSGARVIIAYLRADDPSVGIDVDLPPNVTIF